MNTILPVYTHIVDPRLKHIYLTFDDEGQLLIKSPKVSQRQIEKVLIKKSAWIKNAQKRVLNKKGKKLRFEEGEAVYFRGKPFPLHLKEHSKKRSRLHFDEHEGFVLEFSLFDTEKFQKLVDRFYKEAAEKFIPPLIDLYSDRMQLFPGKVSFRKAKKRWGSCSNSNAISFNYMMMKLPDNVIEYIVVHELAHIRYKHHQKNFWDLVEFTLPGYRQQEKELKNY